MPATTGKTLQWESVPVQRRQSIPGNVLRLTDRVRLSAENLPCTLSPVALETEINRLTYTKSCLMSLVSKFPSIFLVMCMYNKLLCIQIFFFYLPFQVARHRQFGNMDRLSSFYYSGNSGVCAGRKYDRLWSDEWIFILGKADVSTDTHQMSTGFNVVKNNSLAGA